uniref:(northern house mosquito) hypothetical protein n=1 Tax=Culex pipiens TaxID=7175 RepID=A0A8D8F702_CULPI
MPTAAPTMARPTTTTTTKVSSGMRTRTTSCRRRRRSGVGSPGGPKNHQVNLYSNFVKSNPVPAVAIATSVTLIRTSTTTIAIAARRVVTITIMIVITTARRRSTTIRRRRRTLTTLSGRATWRPLESTCVVIL